MSSDSLTTYVDGMRRQKQNWNQVWSTDYQTHRLSKNISKAKIYVRKKQKIQGHTLSKFYVLRQLVLQWMTFALSRIWIKVRLWLSCHQHHPRYLGVSFDIIFLFISTWIFWIRQRNSMFKNLVGLKMKMDISYKTNAYPHYLTTLSSNMDARKDVPNVASARLQI